MSQYWVVLWEKMRRPRVCFGIAVFAVLLLAVSVWAAVGQRRNENTGKKPRIGDFPCSFDTTQGIVLTYVITKSDFKSGELPSDIKIVLRQAPSLAEYWEIYEVAAFFREDGNRRRVIGEGPFPVKAEKSANGDLTRHWTMYDLTRGEYEIAVLLHKVKEGMLFEEVRSAICEQEALAFNVEPVTRLRPHDRVLTWSGVAGGGSQDPHPRD